jgi:adenosylmethionine-8-amino-7-oxononanoate aminotransferase
VFQTYWCKDVFNFKKKPFNPELDIAKKIVDLAFSPEYNLAIYHGGKAGYHIHIDRILIAPPFIIKKKEVDRIVDVLSEVIPRVINEVTSKRR